MHHVVSPEAQRQPHVNIVAEAELRRCDSDNYVLRVVEIDCLADDCGVTAETFLPEPVTDDGEPIPARLTGRPTVWCSQTCRRAAYEERRAAARGAIAVKVVDKESMTAISRAE